MKKPPGLDEHFEHWAIKKRVEHIYRGSCVTNLSILFISILFVFAIGDSFQPGIWYWLVAISTVAVCRILLSLTYSYKQDLISAEGWSAGFFLLSILMSFAWSCLGYFYWSAELEVHKMLIFLLGSAIIATAMAVLSVSKRTFIAYILPIYFSLILGILLSTGEHNIYIALGLSMFVFVIILTGLNSYLNIMKSLYFQYKNQSLVITLRKEIDQRKYSQFELEEHQNELENLVDKRTRQLQASNQALMDEISARKLIEEKLQHQAHHDDLTGLPNRILLIDRLEHALQRAQRHKSQVSVMFIDLNGFKQINDTYGHAAGDLILKTVADRLLLALREEDTISRFGGDEFILLIEQEVGYANTIFLTKKIVNLLSEPINFEKHTLSIGCSIGISVYPNDGNEVDQLLERADVAMYRAKREDEQCCSFYHAAFNKHWD